jgi:hypothetical protein
MFLFSFNPVLIRVNRGFASGLVRGAAKEGGQDPVAFIISTNVNRRHLTKGQQAMAVARARLLSRQPIRQMAQSTGLDKSRVHQASLALKYARDLADSVNSGSTATLP